MKFTPAPGIVLIEPITKEETSVLTRKENTNQRILKGKVLEVGAALTTNANAILTPEPYCKKDDIVVFLSYEGDYDNFVHQNQKYFVVKFEDLRGVIK